MQPLVFVRTGWLEWYDDRLDDGPPVRGGRYNDAKVGSEVNNFRSIHGRCLGYAQTSPLGRGFNLDRLGAKRGAEQLEGVTIVQVATREDGGQVVVGWYKGARCLADSSNRPRSIAGIYNFSALAADSVLLPVKDRTLPAPKGRGGFGQSNVRYADPNAEWVRPILRVIERGTWPSVGDRWGTPPKTAVPPPAPPPTGVTGGQGRVADALRRFSIEQHAVERARRYLVSEGYEVRDVGSVESWDLTCTRMYRGTRESLHVEVKGTCATGGDLSLVFTSNEIELANDDSRATALFVVHGIQVTQDSTDKWFATGGEDTYVKHWRPVAARLAPSAYRYTFNIRERG